MNDRDLKSEMVDGMRAGAEAIEDRGYELFCYRFRLPWANEPQTWDYDDPEPALNQFLEELREQKSTGESMYFDMTIQGSALADLVDKGGEDAVEGAVNQMLYQVNGMVDMQEAEPDENYPLHHEVDIIYKLHTRENYFLLLNFDRGPGERLLSEAEKALEEEGFKVET